MTALPEAMEGLAARPIWVAWNDEGGRKVPKSPHGGSARSNDPATWGTYDQAAETAAKCGYSGVGIMLGDGLGGVDLDGAVKDGEIEPWALEIIEEFGSYAEISPSGTGVHILFWADASKTGAIGRANHAAGIEIYNYGRYFTVTGEQVGASPVADATDAASTFVNREFAGPSPDEAVAAAVARLAADQVKRHANKTMTANCLRDGVRYARVPQGRETCGFCYMLASRGFVYHTAKTAGGVEHYHLSCDCKIVPGFADTEVDGYDPDAMYEVYLEARSKCGGSPGPEKIAREIEKVLSERAELERRGREGFSIPEAKLTRYALCMESERGRDKAIAFREALGFASDDAPEIMRQVYRWMGAHEPSFREKTPYGSSYTADIPMHGKNGKIANVRTGWMLEPGAARMRLTSIYVH